MNDSRQRDEAGVHDEKIAEIVVELSERARRGESIDIAPYVRAHPEYKERLQQLLPTINVLVDLDPSRCQTQGAHELPHKGTGNILGDYQIINVIGRGGMGIVYEAEQLSIGRRVALKVLPFASVLDERQIKRFKNEVRAAGTLDHPHIVPIHAVGEQLGVHYYAMTLIRGQSLAQVIAELQRERPVSGFKEESYHFQSQDESDVAGPNSEDHPPVAFGDTDRRIQTILSTKSGNRGSVAWFRHLAELGRQAAEALQHAHEHGVLHRDVKPANLMLDVQGKLWITDFGLARLEADAGMTMTGDMLGTLRYMSPEQALANRTPVDHRTDIYSLGVTLYELLTLQPALSGESREQLLRQIAFKEPVVPRRINASIPNELEVIVQKAISKDPDDRYAQAQELADDLQRFVEDKPILAKRPSSLQRAVKWCRRHRSLSATILIAFVVVLLITSITSVIIAQKEQNARKAATDSASREKTLREQISANADRIGRMLANSYIEQAHATCQRGDVGSGMLRYAATMSIVPENAEDLRRVIRANIAAWSSRLNVLTAILDHEGKVNDVAYSPDGKMVVTACGDGFVRFWDVSSGELQPNPLRHESAVLLVAYSSDGTEILTATDQSITKLWRTDGSPPEQSIRHPGVILAIGKSRSGWRVTTHEQDGPARIRDAGSGKVIGNPLSHDAPILSAAIESNGHRVITGGTDRIARIWNAETGILEGELTEDGDVTAVGFSPSGSRLITGIPLSRLRTWDAQTFELLSTDWNTSVPTRVVMNNSDDRLLSAGRFSNAPFVWEPSNELHHYIGSPLRHADDVTAVSFSPDGSHAITGSLDGTARIWRLIEDQQVIFEWHLDDPTSPRLRQPVKFSPDGTHVLRTDGNKARVWNSITGEVVGEPLVQQSAVNDAVYNPDGSRILTGSEEGVARLWKTDQYQPVGPEMRHENRITVVAFSPDGSSIYTGSRDETIRKWDARTGEAQGEPIQTQFGVQSLDIIPDGSLILAGGYGGKCITWNASTRESLGNAKQLAGNVISVAFSPDGTKFLTGLANPWTVRMWDTSTREAIGKTMKNENGAIDLAFTPNGAFFFAGGQLRDTSTCHAIGPTLYHNDKVAGLVGGVAVSPNGQRVATASKASTRIWQMPVHSLSGSDKRVIRWIEVITGLQFDIDADPEVQVLDAKLWRRRCLLLEGLGGPPMLE